MSFHDPRQRASSPRRGRASKLVLAVGLIVLVCAGGYLLFGPKAAAPAGPLDGKLVVGIKRSASSEPPRQVDELGAVPVRASDYMFLEAQYSQPAHTYLIWIDSQGKVIPLYPWNMDELEVTNLDDAPPSTTAAKFVMNPMSVGRGWTFGKGEGLHTIVLLARRTPVEKNVKLAGIFAALGAAKMRDPTEVAIVALDRADAAPRTLVSLHRGDETSARETDRQLTAILGQLQPHFELIRAVRFAHQDK